MQGDKKRPDKYEITRCDGFLCVGYTSSNFNNPGIVVMHWPTRSWRPEDIGHLGKEVKGSAQHGYQYRDDMGNWTPAFMLRDGGQTKAVKVETFHYPPPKVRAGIETRYQSGKWQKHLKARGWVDA